MPFPDVFYPTLYGEKSVADKKHPETAFSDSWKHYGFQIDSDRISLLSIVIYDPYSDVTFVGHTGILIKYRDDYLFVEKIAFEQPYQATKVKTVDELLNILSLRPEYFGEEGEAGPFVYNNGEYIGTLKAKDPLFFSEDLVEWDSGMQILYSRILISFYLLVRG